MQKKKVIKLAAALLIALTACIPMLNGTTIAGSETAMSLGRIQGLYEAVHAGKPTVFETVNGSFIFQSDLFLMIPVLGMLCGMSLYHAYHVFLFLIFWASAYFMESLAEEIIHRDRISVFLTAMLYVSGSSVYYSMLSDGSLSAALSLVWMPVFLHGCYGLLYQKKDSWMRLIPGLCGLILSDIRCFFTAAVFLILLCIRKKIWRKKKKCLKLLVSIIVAFLLTCWFTLPMLKVHASLPVGSLSDDSLLQLADWIVINRTHAGHGAGIALTLMPLLMIRSQKKRGKKFALNCAACGYLLLLLSTNLFHGLHAYFSFDIPYTCLLAIAAGYGFAWHFYPQESRENIRLSLAGLFLLINGLQINTFYNMRGDLSASDSLAEYAASVVFSSSGTAAEIIFLLLSVFMLGMILRLYKGRRVR